MDKARDWLQKGSDAGSPDCDKVLAEMMDDATPAHAPGSSTLH
jgi:hypothetical protein